MQARALGFFLWVLVVFGLFNAGADHAGRRAVEQAMSSGQWSWTPASTVRAVRAYLNNEGDVRRYFAYCNALLGRPYDSYYVRSEAAWRAAFARAENADPDQFPTVRPDRPLLPYRDYLVEYPPGFFLWALPPAIFTTDFFTYQILFASFMGLLLTGALVLAQRQGPRDDRVPAWAAAGMFALGVFSVHRFDAVVAILLGLSAWAAVNRRATLFGAITGVAIATKIVPVLVLPLWAADVWRRRARGELARGASALAATLLAFWLPALLIAGPGVGDALSYQAQRPLQIESTAAAILGVARAVLPTTLTMEYSFGSLNVRGSGTGAAGLLSLAALAAALAGIFLLTWQRLARERVAADRSRALLQGFVAVLLALMVLGKVFSPQYLVWIIPLGLVLSSTAMRALLLLALALSQIIYPAAYSALESLRPWACALVLLRNGLLGYWGLRLLMGPAQSFPRQTPDARGL